MAIAFPITTLVPVRKMPSDRSEMTTQLIFGQGAEPMERLNAWIRIRILDDGYEGWVDGKMLAETPAGDEGSGKDNIYVLPWFLNAAPGGDKQEMILPPGSILRSVNRTQHSFKACGNTYTWQAELPEMNTTDSGTSIIFLARRFLGAPYLWGGKSPFGIDCSGLVQLIHAIHRIRLPRDAHQQAEAGKGVAFIQETRAGDLAFFGREENMVSHVGIITGTGTVIHASGTVREDLLDQEGIYVKERKNYSHKLRMIRRIIT